MVGTINEVSSLTTGAKASALGPLTKYSSHPEESTTLNSVRFSLNGGVHPFQEAAHFLNRTHWHQPDYTPILNYLDFLSGFQPDLFSDFFGNHNLILGRHSHRTHRTLLSTHRSSYHLSIDSFALPDQLCIPV